MNERLMPMRRLLFSAVLLIIAPSTHAEWESMPPLPEASGGSLAGTDNSNLYVVGGTSVHLDGAKQWLRKVWRLDLKGRKWHLVTELSAPIAYGLAGTWLNPQPAFLFGAGSDGVNQIDKVFWIENDVTKDRKVEIPSAGVRAGGGILQDGYLIFVGGTHDAEKHEHLSSKTWALDLFLNRLIRLRDFPGKPFEAAASAVSPEGLYVFGGAIWNAARKEVESSDAAQVFVVGKNEWHPLRAMPYAVRGAAAVSLRQGLVYVAGGCKSDLEGYSNEALIYELHGDSYRKAKSLPYAAVTALVMHDGYVYCLGGEDGWHHRTDKVFRIQADELLKQ